MIEFLEAIFTALVIIFLITVALGLSFGVAAKAIIFILGLGDKR